jgi:kumamolisin
MTPNEEPSSTERDTRPDAGPMASAARTRVPGSERAALPQAVEPVEGSEPATVTVVLRRRAPLPSVESIDGPISPQALTDRFGADPRDIATVTAALEEAGLRVVAASPASRTLRVTGTVDQLSGFFGTRLYRGTVPGHEGTFRTRAGQLSVPAALGDAVIAVLGLDDRPQAAPRSVRADPNAATSFTPPELAELYGMPDADGAGQTIAIIELGGGFEQSDLDHYFAGLGLPTPSVQAVGIDGAENLPGEDPNGADGEVMLDIEVAGGIAPGADQVVYFAPNTDAGFLDAVTAATQATPTPVAISISWGQSEDQWTAQARTAMDDAFADAATLGITVTCAAGDTGSSDMDPGAGSHVDFPASSPHALGCGGTTLHATDGKVTSETVWNSSGSTGGGVSRVFPVPEWQVRAGVPTRERGGRGVPDVAAVADPNTGYEVYVDGSPAVYGGTSAVSPLWAGLVARVAQLAAAPPGFVQPALYAGAAAGEPSTALRDITTGNNGAFRAGPGWDACTGLGVPEPATAEVLGAPA